VLVQSYFLPLKLHLENTLTFRKQHWLHSNFSAALFRQHLSADTWPVFSTYSSLPQTTGADRLRRPPLPPAGCSGRSGYPALRTVARGGTVLLPRLGPASGFHNGPRRRLATERRGFAGAFLSAQCRCTARVIAAS